MFTINPNFKH